MVLCTVLCNKNANVTIWKISSDLFLSFLPSSLFPLPPPPSPLTAHTWKAGQNKQKKGETKRGKTESAMSQTWWKIQEKASRAILIFPRDGVCYWPAGGRKALCKWRNFVSTLFRSHEECAVCRTIKFSSCKSRPAPNEPYPSSIPESEHPCLECEVRTLTMLLTI